MCFILRYGGLPYFKVWRFALHSGTEVCLGTGVCFILRYGGLLYIKVRGLPYIKVRVFALY